MEPCKNVFILIMKIPNKQFTNEYIKNVLEFNKYRCNPFPNIQFTMFFSFDFRREHPIISKIPFLNWYIFKMYFDSKIIDID